MEIIVHYPSYGRKQLVRSLLPTYLNEQLSQLDVQVSSITPDTRDFWKINFTDVEDPVLLRSFLAREIGLKLRASEIKESLILQGRISSTNVGFGIFVDIGLRPKKDGLLPLHHLRTILPSFRDKKPTLRSLLNLFGWGVGWPLRVEIDSITWQGSTPKINLKLEDLFVEEFLEFLQEGNEMLNVIGVTKSEIKRALSSSGHVQDIVLIQSHGILEHTLFTAATTHVVGLIPELGPHLKKGRFFTIGASLPENRK